MNKFAQKTLSFILALSIVFTAIPTTFSDNQEEKLSKREVKISMAKLLALGYSNDDAIELLEKAKRGEPLTQFHEAEYETYNCSPDVNGLDGDYLLVYGEIDGYIYYDDGTIAMVVSQTDGNQWLVIIGLNYFGTTIGLAYSGYGYDNIFEGNSGKQAEIYGEYIGYSDAYQMPALQVATYGGIVVEDDMSYVLIQTNTAHTAMYRANHGGLNTLIGVSQNRLSVEKIR